jgi:hypothetical protein
MGSVSNAKQIFQHTLAVTENACSTTATARFTVLSEKLLLYHGDYTFTHAAL